MFLEFLAQQDLLVWPVVGLVIFFTVFVAVLVRLALGGRRPGVLAEITALPLEDDERSFPSRPEDESR
jgi:hypothetical protein